MKDKYYQLAVDNLRGLLATARKSDETFQDIAGQRDVVLARYQPIFNPTAISRLTEAQFKSFLLFENNHHWSGLNRKGHRACADMKALRQSLALLLDEKKPLTDRMNHVADEVPGMGKALITAILLVAYPDKYGVWNNTSETSLNQLQVWPEFDRGLTFGKRYELMNAILLRLANDLGIDLWTLDALHWRVISHDGNDGKAGEPVPPTGDVQTFGLERHLHDFLRDNWGRTSLGKEWALYAEQGDDEAGYEYVTDIGKIDLLAKHRTKPRWLVVELKRAQTSDETAGQVLRYMGWVRRKMAQKGATVEGLIIAHDADDKLRYAISELADVKLMLYDVSFSLQNDSKALSNRE